MDYTEPENLPKPPTPTPPQQPAEQGTTNPYTPGVQETVVVGEPTSDEKMLSMLAHLSPLVGFGILAPLIIFLVKKDSSEYITKHAKEALNFQLSLLIYSIAVTVVSLLLCFTFILLPAIAVFSIVIAIIAGIKANEGKFYECPLCIRMIK